MLVSFRVVREEVLLVENQSLVAILEIRTLSLYLDFVDVAKSIIQARRGRLSRVSVSKAFQGCVNALLAALGLDVLERSMISLIFDTPCLDTFAEENLAIGKHGEITGVATLRAAVLLNHSQCPETSSAASLV